MVSFANGRAEQSTSIIHKRTQLLNISGSSLSLLSFLNKYWLRCTFIRIGIFHLHWNSLLYSSIDKSTHLRILFLANFLTVIEKLFSEFRWVIFAPKMHETWESIAKCFWLLKGSFHHAWIRVKKLATVRNQEISYGFVATLERWIIISLDRVSHTGVSPSGLYT